VIFLGKEIDLFFLKESETNGNFVIRRLSGERIVSSPTYYKCFHLTLWYQRCNPKMIHRYTRIFRLIVNVLNQRGK